MGSWFPRKASAFRHRVLPLRLMASPAAACARFRCVSVRWETKRMEVHGLCTWCDRLEWCRRVFLDRRIALSLHSPKTQRVPEVLQLSVAVERAGPPSFESEPSYADVTRILSKLVEGAAQVDSYDVSNSTFHKIGAAATAQ